MIRTGGSLVPDDPSHIHLHVDAAVHQHRYVTIWLEGDPRLTSEKRRSLDAETVIVTPTRTEGGGWTFRHDVRLSGS